MIRPYTITVTPTGSAGSAAGDSTHNLVASGIIRRLHIAYAASSAATTDVTISVVANGDIPALTILTVSDNATSGWYVPMHAIHTSAGAAIADQYDLVAICSRLKVAVAQADPDKTVTVTVLVEE